MRFWSSDVVRNTKTTVFHYRIRDWLAVICHTLSSPKNPCRTEARPTRPRQTLPDPAKHCQTKANLAVPRPSVPHLTSLLRKLHNIEPTKCRTEIADADQPTGSSTIFRRRQAVHIQADCTSG